MYQKWSLLEPILTSVVSRACGNTCKRRTGPPQNMWCFSVLFCVAKCESEIAKTGRRRIPKDGIGRSHRDLAIRSLESPVNLAFALNTAVYAPAQKCHAQVWHLSGPYRWWREKFTCYVNFHEGPKSPFINSLGDYRRIIWPTRCGDSWDQSEQVLSRTL